MKNVKTIILSHASISLLLFVVFAAIYWFSIPDAFNTQPENRKYFDSDGEFIIRQFNQNKIFTHNDHLLYHILGKAIADGPAAKNDQPDPVSAHKMLSTAFGALGVSFFFVFGALITKRKTLSAICAVFAGGTAGWWFFSSTIDTYIPCLSVSIPVLGLAVLSLRSDSHYKAMAIGALAGLAFLFRTDSVLLALLAVYTLKNSKSLFKDAVYAGCAGLIVGMLGYIMLSHFLYNIELSPQAMWDWLSGSSMRPESANEKIWGVSENLTLRNTLLVFVNHSLYTIFLPGLAATGDAIFFLSYVKGGWIGLIVWLATISTAIFQIIKHARAQHRKGDNTLTFICILSGVWFFSRLVFYTWWDPYDPFLFAVMALPSIWLIILIGFDMATSENTKSKQRKTYWSILIILTIAVWAHNTYYLIKPLQICTTEQVLSFSSKHL